MVGETLKINNSFERGVSMSSLKELIEGNSKVPGDIKVKKGDWKPDRYFTPYYNIDGSVYGIRAINIYTFRGASTGSVSYNTNDGPWELYVEPKKKVKLYRYLLKSTSSETFKISTYLYPSWDAAARSNANYEVVRIHGEPIEVEED